VFEALALELTGRKFDTDAAAGDEDHLCDYYLKDEGRGIEWRQWRGAVWCNPPFADIEPWVEAALGYDDAVYMLCPANPCSAWFRRAIHNMCNVVIPNRRICFWHPDEEPRHPDRDTLVLVFGPGVDRSIYCTDIPKHFSEVKRLWAEASGQGVLL
jgi:hypothetical protein